MTNESNIPVRQLALQKLEGMRKTNEVLTQILKKPEPENKDIALAIEAFMASFTVGIPAIERLEQLVRPCGERSDLKESP